MTTQDQRAAFEAQIELPPLPSPFALWKDPTPTASGLVREADCDVFEADQMQEYARVAIEHDRKGRGEPVDIPSGWREQFKEAVYDNLAAADNQDIPLEEYPDRILKVLDTVVGPHHPTVVKWRNDAIKTCLAIAHKYCRDAETQRYLKQDLEALITSVPQPAEPVKYPADKIGFELWAQSHGDLPLDPWDGKANHSWSPATYRHNLTEIAWRAWANKPEATSEPAKAPSDDAIDYEALYDQMCERCDVLDAKLAEYERLADNKDAARYRWIRQHWGRINDTYDGDTGHIIEVSINDDNEGWDVDPDSLDAAIDVARAQPDSCDEVNIAVFGE